MMIKNLPFRIVGVSILKNNLKVLFDFLGMTHKFHHINELPPLYKVERGSGG
jgi:hypothetical protein